MIERFVLVEGDLTAHDRDYIQEGGIQASEINLEIIVVRCIANHLKGEVLILQKNDLDTDVESLVEQSRLNDLFEAHQPIVLEPGGDPFIYDVTTPDGKNAQFVLVKYLDFTPN